MTREEAIKILTSEIYSDEIAECGVKFNVALGVAIKALKQEPDTGHWIVYADCEGKTRRCVCDRCGHKTGEYTWKNPNYCSNCGARMESEENEND
jgi:hypothetical protein